MDPSLKNIDGISYLFGTVIAQTKKRAGKGLSYDVQWEDSTLGITSVDVALVLSGVELCKKVSKNNDEGPFSPDSIFNEHVLSYLTNHVETGEEGDPLDSDDDDGVKEIVTSNPIQFGARHEPEGAQFLLPEELHKSKTGGPKRDDGLRFKWRADTEIPEPVGISRDKTTTVKPEYTSFFSSPINSFLSFVPLKLFKTIVFFSNKYAHDVMSKNANNLISGANWNRDISINEMMVFFGILIKMTLWPMPGQPYENAWKDRGWHPYTPRMALRHFQQIRSVLHLNDNTKMSTSADSLFKVRPLLNTVKVTFAKYLNVGSEVALDEASVASRSKYGGFSIFYNPMKPGGKYHFRFYMLCCATTYACFRLRMHSRDLSDSAGGFVPVSQRPASATLVNNDEGNSSEPDEDENAKNKDNDKEDSRLMSLVLDMCRPLQGSGRTVNMDNYYTSPEIAVQLREMDISMRGTVHKDRYGFPRVYVSRKRRLLMLKSSCSTKSIRSCHDKASCCTS